MTTFSVNYWNTVQGADASGYSSSNTIATSVSITDGIMLYSLEGSKEAYLLMEFIKKALIKQIGHSEFLIHRIYTE